MSFRRALIVTDYCISPHECIENAGILIENNEILSIGGASAFTRDPDLAVIELNGCYALPGFIDSHIHGAGGFDSSTAYDPSSTIESMCSTLASHGVTSFVPTIISSPIRSMISALESLVQQVERPHKGADPVGIHMEGPFISKEKHGSQRIEDILEIDLGLAREIIAAGKGKIKIFTFAPELAGAVKFVELLRENNIIPSMGHTLATEEQILKVVDAGACRCTHMYNGMPPLHQRNISLAAVALTDDRITIEMILDGAHLHPRMVDIACRSKPKHLIVGISDAIQAAGLHDGLYHLGLSEVKVESGRATTSDGVLAGTTLTLEKGWHHLINYTNMKKTDAAACLTINPAKSINLHDRGELRPGKRADIAIFDSTTQRTRMTIVSGKIAYNASPDNSLCLS